MDLWTSKCLITMIGNTAIKLDKIQVKTKNNISVVQNINLNIEKNSCNLLIGPTGSGKTTILRLIKGLIPYLIDYDVTGKIFIDNELKTEQTFFRQSIDIGFLFQDFELQFIGSTVELELAFSLENMGQPKEVITERINWIKENYPHIIQIMNRNPHTLSGGELAQVVFLSTILNDQNILLFDEPLQNLDSKGTRIFLQTLQAFLHSKTIIISTHHIEQFIPYTDNFFVLNTITNQIDQYKSKREFLTNTIKYPWLNITKKAIDYYLRGE